MTKVNSKSKERLCLNRASAIGSVCSLRRSTYRLSQPPTSIHHHHHHHQTPNYSSPLIRPNALRSPLTNNARQTGAFLLVRPPCEPLAPPLCCDKKMQQHNSRTLQPLHWLYSRDLVQLLSLSTCYFSLTRSLQLPTCQSRRALCRRPCPPSPTSPVPWPTRTSPPLPTITLPRGGLLIPPRTVAKHPPSEEGPRIPPCWPRRVCKPITPAAAIRIPKAPRHRLVAPPRDTMVVWKDGPPTRTVIIAKPPSSMAFNTPATRVTLHLQIR